MVIEGAVMALKVVGVGAAMGTPMWLISKIENPVARTFVLVTFYGGVLLLGGDILVSVFRDGVNMLYR
jgi:hypothetical protein